MSTIAVQPFKQADRITTDGLELEMKARFREGSYIALNYTFQHSENSNTGKRLPETPTHKGNIMFNYRFAKYLNFYSDLFLKGNTPRAEGDTRPGVPGYALVNTALTARNFLKGYEGLEISASIYNLFDKNYWDPSPVNTMPSDYPKPGRNFLLEVRYTW